MDCRYHERVEQDALIWVKEVNRRSPTVKWDRKDYDDFLSSGLTIGQWLRQRLMDPAFTEEDYPYGQCDS